MNKKTTTNNENLCPLTRKRLKSITIANTASVLAEENSSFWNPLQNLTKNKDEASVSEPILFQTTLVAEMGIGMLDSEDSSSSVASGNALAASVSADENSNDNTLNLDASFCQQRRNHRSTDISMDKSNDNISKTSFSNETSDAKNSYAPVASGYRICNNHAIDDFSDDSKQLTQHRVNSDKQILPQYKKISLLGAGIGIIPAIVTNTTNSNNKLPTGSGITSKSTRSPLATVICNNYTGSGGKFQQNFMGGNCSNGNVNNTNSHLMGGSTQNIARAPSPSMPSTSQQAALFKHQQQLRNLESQKNPDQVQAKLPPSRLVPNKNFFLYRNQLTRSLTFAARDNFTTLSDEIILQIFKWLPKKTLMRCCCVCRRFNRCAKDESLWTRLDLGGRSLRSGALENVLTRGVVILRLAQTEFNHPVFEARSSLSEPDFLTKLQYLDLSMIYITKPSLKMLLSRCRELKKLSLEHVPLNDEICYEIANNVNLEALNMAMCLGLEAWSVRKIMESLINLNSLNISWTNLTVDAVTSLVTNISPNIMRINIAGCRTTMFDSHLSSLAKRCPQLLELDLSDCTGLTSNAIGIVCKFKMLEYLSLSRCYQIPASSYMDLSNLRTLTYLDVFGILSDTALEMLEHNFPSLGINKFIHSSVARPTVGTRRTSIWGLRTRD